ncbi:conserved hypothetical protein [Candidatus Blochmanniella vafra str. BVAF]|uniref:Uncharacterized protein n=1 Tax=Blochmanniella vafra (strain BVAF) TaxID=859654 RepID=E8Q699_BLOVB|nr:hypothetical protein [Candidatus Blochmannia vafer]ADV33793.1 conserved hypothetical protein [Candidatus Blochmannia vafer str. BVAF]
MRKNTGLVFSIVFFINIGMCIVDNIAIAVIIKTVNSELHDVIESMIVVNWKIILYKMLQDVSFFKDNINYNSSVLINIFKNNSSRVVQTINITNILINLILENNNDTYTIISLNKLYHIYRELEVSYEDVVNSYEFSVKVANYLKADYIIYGNIYDGDMQGFNVELQLLSSNTGEILRVVNNIKSNDDMSL